MTIASYSELLTEIDAWLNRTDLSARVPTFIRLFEARMNRRLRDPDMECQSTQETTASTSNYALPTDCRKVRELYMAEDPTVVLEYMSPQAMRDTYADNTTGEPVVYTIIGNELVLAPTPDGAYTLTLTYVQEIPDLTSTNTTNWLLDDHPDAYLWGSLCMAEAFVQNDERLAVWKAAWDEALSEIIREGNQRRVTGGPLCLRPTIIE